MALQTVLEAAPDELRWISAARHTSVLLLVASLIWLVISMINGLTNGIIALHPATGDDNLEARRIYTQARVLCRSAIVVVLLAGLALMLMTFPGAKQLGASLLASAGVLGIIAGLAAKPVFSNLLAGLQIALAQPIRIDDVLIVKGEWGRVEEITGTYVVLKIWDERRLIIPLQWFIENPFENWTRTGSQITGVVQFNVDFSMPVAPLRAELERLVPTLPEWDKRFFNLQVTDSNERTMLIRILLTAQSSSKAFDLRCKVREAMIGFMQREYPQHLPTLRVLDGDPPAPFAAMHSQRTPESDQHSPASAGLEATGHAPDSRAHVRQQDN
jgi:small-conductance mechanosensitive channel